MGMTMTQKILAAHAGLDSVTAGQLIEAKLDVVMANDITGPMALPIFRQMADKVFDKDKVVLVPDHFTPNKDIKSAINSRSIQDFAKEQGLNNMVFGKFFFVAFPKDTPDDIVNTFSAAMKKVVENPEFVKAAEDSYALTPVYMDPKEATEYAQQVYDKLNSYKDLFVAQ